MRVMPTPSSLVASTQRHGRFFSTSSSLLLLLLVVVAAAALSLPYAANAGSSHHLTAGFSRVKLSEKQFVVKKPYNVPLSERYEFVHGIRRIWVFATDKPTSSTHPGGPRTEIKVDVRTNLVYTAPPTPPHASTVMRSGSRNVAVYTKP